MQIPDQYKTPGETYDDGRVWDRPNGSVPVKYERAAEVMGNSVEDLAARPDFFPDVVLNEIGEDAAPEIVEKLTEVFARKDMAPLDVGAVLSGAAVAAPEAIKDFVEGGLNLAGIAGRTALGGVAGLAGGDLGEWGRRTASQASAEGVSALELGFTESASLLSGLGRRIKDKATGRREIFTPQEWRARLFASAAMRKQLGKIGEGRGEIAQAVGTDADSMAQKGVMLQPDTIRSAAELLEPDTFLPGAAAFKGVKKSITKAAQRLPIATGSRIFGEGLKKTGAALETAAKKAGAVRSGQVGAIAGALGDGGMTWTGGAALFSGGALAAKGTGKALQAAGKRLTGEVAPGVAWRMGGSAAKGAIYGTAASAPFAAGAQWDSEIGAILGGGAAVGGGLGAVTRGGQEAGQALVSSLYKKAPEVGAVQEHPAYGESPVNDTDHAAALQHVNAVNPPLANIANRLRAVLEPLGARLYLLKPDAFDARLREQMGVGPGDPVPNAGGWIANNNDIFVRVDSAGDARAVTHEPGHFLVRAMSSLSPEQANGLFHAISRAYSPEQRLAFFQDQVRRLGEAPIPGWDSMSPEQQLREADSYIIDEIAAETFSAVLNNSPIDPDAVRPGLLAQVTEMAASFLETIGLYDPQLLAQPDGSLVTPEGVMLSPDVATRAKDFFKGELQSDEVRASLAKISGPAPTQPQPAPAPQATPAPTVTPSPVPAPQPAAPAQPNLPGFADTQPAPQLTQPAQPQPQLTQQSERTDIGLAEAEAVVASQPPEVKRNFAILREHLRVPAGQAVPIEVRYRGVPSLVVPLDFITTKDGRVQIRTLSPENVLASAGDYAKGAFEKKVDHLIPFETVSGKFTDQGKKDFLTALEIYLLNQSHGYTGAGASFTRPANVEGFIPPEDAAYSPIALAQPVANFVNLALNIAPPATNRTQRDKATGQPITPANVRARSLAEANQRPVMKPGAIAQPAKQTYADFGVDIAEFNPLRKALDEAGVARPRQRVNENLNLEHIEAITPRPESGFRSGATSLITANFMPQADASQPGAEPTPEQVDAMTPSEFQRAATKVWDGGLTGFAIRLGASLPESAMQQLEAYRDNSHRRSGEFKAQGDIESAFTEMSRGQFFREAIEANRAARGEEGLSVTRERLAEAGASPRVFMPDPARVVRKENAEVRKVADAYMATTGRPYEPDNAYPSVPVELAKRVSDFYDQAESRPDDPEVQSAYQALADETLAQFEAMREAGYTVEPWDGEGEPYPNSAAMIEDAEQNKHLYFLRTENAYGAGDAPQIEDSNPLTQPSGIEVNGVPLLVNDVFRAVHDFFGHVKNGYQFGPRGEYNAWRSHSQMFSEAAQGALAAETLAQNFWVNFGPQMRDADGNIRTDIPLTQRQFAEQKVLTVPQELIDEAAVRFMPGRPDEAAVEEFKRAESIQKALTKPGWTLLTATVEADGAGTDPVNVKANSRLREELVERGFPFVEVRGSYKGVDQGTNFLITGITQEEALDLGRKYRQESVLTNEGLIYSDGTRNPVDPASTFIGDLAKEQDFYSQIKGGPAFSLGIDFSVREPVPERVDVRFMPARTDAGRELELKDLKIEHKGTPLLRTVEIRKRGRLVGEIHARRLAPEVSEIEFVEITPKNRGKGIGQALYRELATQLQDDGVELLGGRVIAPEPIAIREKIFGPFEEITTNKGEDLITKDEALARLEIFRAGESGRKLPDILPINRIDPNVRYMPRSEDLPAQHAREALPNSVDADIPVVHYSSQNLQEVDPRKFGKAFATPNDLRGDLKSYFFVTGSPLGRDEQFFGRGDKLAFGAKISGAALYDLRRGRPDPLGWGSKINRLEADEAVQEAGYAGILVETGADDGRQAVLMFKPVNVVSLGKPAPAGAALRFMPGFFSQAEAIASTLPNVTKSTPARTVPGRVIPERTIKGKDGKERVIPARTEPDKSYPAVSARDQVIATLEGGGVTRDEIEWSGIEEFLAGKDEVTKAELLDFLAANRLEIKETMRGDLPGKRLIWEKLPRVREWKLYQSGTGKAFFKIEHVNGEYVLLDEFEDVAGRFDSIEAAQEAGTLAGEEQGIGHRNSEPPKYEKYTLPGGQNYREVLFQLPALTPPAEVKQLSDGSWRVLSQGGSASFGDTRERAMDRYLAQQGDISSFRGSHWDEPNVLAHTRVADHQTPEGESVMLAEEIQSDWHQKGRREGYQSRVKNRAELEDKAGVLALIALGQVSEIPDGAIERHGIPLEITTEEAKAQAIQLQASLGKNDGVPDAPFKNTWHELVFKALLRDAVAGGKDYLAWTPGEIQADRYDLSKQVDSVRVSKQPDGRFELDAVKDGETVISQQDLLPAKLADTIGKELADKAVTDLQGDRTVATYSGDDLRAGGAGMKGFYDKMLVAFANKYGKKWGAKVQTIKLVVDASENQHPRPEVWALPITNPMRQSVPKGQPLFMPGGRVSTRVPTAVKAKENVYTDDLVIGLDAFRKDPVVFKRAADTLSKYEIMGGVKGTPEQRITEFKKRVVDNLLWLHDNFERRDRSKKWYDGANKIATDWADQFQRPVEGNAGIIAALSPQRDWFQNVSLASRVLSAPENFSRFGPTEKQLEWMHHMDPKGDYAELTRGKKFVDMSPLGRAAFLRSFEALYGDPRYRVVLPEGEFGDYARNADGTEAKVQWGSFSQIARAFEIFDNPTPEVISDALGDAHKVRNFYNNIVDPNGPAGDVTIDTHAIAAGLLQPLTGFDIEVSHNFGKGVGAPISAIYGIRGTYGVFADAYREAAAERGLKPREMQSITWEAVRALFKDTWKTDKNKKLVKDIWKEYTNGSKSLDETLNAIKDAAGGFRDPDWVSTRPGAGVDAAQGPTPDAGSLSSTGFRGLEIPALSGRGSNVSAGIQDAVIALRQAADSLAELEFTALV